LLQLQGRCLYNLHKWGLASSDLCACGQQQTMNHTVNMCPFTSSEVDSIPYMKPVMTQSTGWSLSRLQHSTNEINYNSTHTILTPFRPDNSDVIGWSDITAHCDWLAERTPLQVGVATRLQFRWQHFIWLIDKYLYIRDVTKFEFENIQTFWQIRNSTNSSNLFSDECEFLNS